MAYRQTWGETPDFPDALRGVSVRYVEFEEVIYEVLSKNGEYCARVHGSGAAYRHAESSIAAIKSVRNERYRTA